MTSVDGCRVTTADAYLGVVPSNLTIRSDTEAAEILFEERRAGGVRERTLPDFFIGAHATVAGHRLLTRGAARYRGYFPDLDIISPETHP